MRMAVVFVSYGRIDLAIEAVESQRQFKHLFPEHDVFMGLQAYTQEDIGKFHKAHPHVNVFMSPAPLGCSGARAWMTDEVRTKTCSKYDVIYTCDDDFVFIPESNIKEAVKVLFEKPLVGFLQVTTYAKTHEIYDVLQPVLATGGGYMFKPQLIDALGNWDKTEYFDDLEFAARAYLAGYDNWRTTRAQARHRRNRKDSFIKFFETHEARSKFSNEYKKFMPKLSVEDMHDGTNQAPLPGCVFTHLNALGKQCHDMNREALIKGRPRVFQFE